MTQAGRRALIANGRLTAPLFVRVKRTPERPVEARDVQRDGIGASPSWLTSPASCHIGKVIRSTRVGKRTLGPC